MTDDAGDPLGEIDRILSDRTAQQRERAELTAKVQSARSAFLDDFKAVCEMEIMPAMDEVVGRLRRNGGGGLVQYLPDGGPTIANPRLTLWMSLEGEITGTPRQDRHPYVQLDADVRTRKVQVSAGDMWQGQGSHHSGPVCLWDITGLTAEAVTDEAVEILRRAARM